MANSTESIIPDPTEELLQQYADLGDSLKGRIPCLEWEFHVPWIHAIRALKRKRNAIIMAHNYQAPEIFHTVADFTGDSLALAQEASRRRFHSGDGESTRARPHDPDPGRTGGLFTRFVDHGRRRASLAQALSRRSGRYVRQHVGGGEG